MGVACDSKIAFGAKHSADGLIPYAMARTIAPRRVWAKLVQAKAGGDVGLAAECDGGYVLQPGFTRVSAPDNADWSRTSYQFVYDRDGRVCRYCGSAENPTIDHVRPRCQGGGDGQDNLVVACRSCNSRKGGRTPEQAGMRLLPVPGGA